MNSSPGWNPDHGQRQSRKSDAFSSVTPRNAPCVSTLSSYPRMSTYMMSPVPRGGATEQDKKKTRH